MRRHHFLYVFFSCSVPSAPSCIYIYIYNSFIRRHAFWLKAWLKEFSQGHLRIGHDAGGLRTMGVTASGCGGQPGPSRWPISSAMRWSCRASKKSPVGQPSTNPQGSIAHSCRAILLQQPGGAGPPARRGGGTRSFTLSFI